MTRVVLDTNVFVSAVLGGRLAAVIDHWLAGQFTLLVTGEIVREYLAVLRRPKFALPDTTIDDIIGYVFHKAEFVTPTEQLHLVEADPNDDKFLEAAAAGGATLIVSGDQHLLSLPSFRDISIITPRQFLDHLEGDQ